MEKIIVSSNNPNPMSIQLLGWLTKTEFNIVVNIVSSHEIVKANKEGIFRSFCQQLQQCNVLQPSCLFLFPYILLYCDLYFSPFSFLLIVCHSLYLSLPIANDQCSISPYRSWSLPFIHFFCLVIFHSSLFFGESSLFFSMQVGSSLIWGKWLSAHDLMIFFLFLG